MTLLLKLVVGGAGTHGPSICVSHRYPGSPDDTLPESAIIDMNEARRDSEHAALAIGFGSASVLVGTILLSAAHTAALDFAVEPVSNGAVVTLKRAF